MFANVEIKFLKLFIAFIFSLLCSRDDDQSETFKVSGNLDYECKWKCKDVHLMLSIIFLTYLYLNILSQWTCSYKYTYPFFSHTKIKTLITLYILLYMLIKVIAYGDHMPAVYSNSRDLCIIHACV